MSAVWGVSKRGLSDIITNVLIILLVLVAVGIIWAFVKPFLSTSLSSSGPVSDSYTARLAVLPRSVDTTTIPGTLSLVVERKAGGANAVINKVKVVLKGTEATKSYECEITGLDELETAPCTIGYGNDGLGTIVEISLVPVFTVDGEETTGQITDVYDVASGTSTTPAQDCGNVIREGSEQCDGSIGSETCASRSGVGYTGTLTCVNPDLPNECTFDTSLCFAPSCDNDGVIDGAWEQCDDGNIVGSPVDGCSSSCTIDSGWTCGNLPSQASQCLQFTVSSPSGVYDKQHSNFWLNFVYNIPGADANSCSYLSNPATQQAVASGTTGLSCVSQNINLRYRENAGLCSYEPNLDISNNGGSNVQVSAVGGTAAERTQFNNAVRATDNINPNFIICPSSNYALNLTGVKGGVSLSRSINFNVKACLGEINMDGFVNSEEEGLLNVLDVIGSGGTNCPSGNPQYCTGDLDGDGIILGDVGETDFVYFQNNFRFNNKFGSCRSSASGGLCGNGIIDTGETCESSIPLPGGLSTGCNILAGGTVTYPGTRACTNCLVSCDIGGAYCGNNLVDFNSGEICDGTDLGGSATCNDLFPGTSGVLACNPSCDDYDISNCS
ncbi:MAG: hypothetical protein AABW79_00025 [Nanoarchaeota archaeon]